MDGVLVEINRAEQALEAASDIYEMLNLRDMAAAYELIASARGFKEAAQKAKIFQLKAERKAGEWLAENVEQGGHNSKSHDETLLPDGIDKYESSRWQQEAKVSEEIFNDWIDECLSTNKEITAAGLRRLAKGVFPRVTTVTAGHLNLNLTLVLSAIKDHDIEFLLERDTEDFFNSCNLPYDLILDWVESGCKSIEVYFCDMLNKLYKEPMIDEEGIVYEPISISV